MNSIDAVRLIEEAGVSREQAEAIVMQIEKVVDERAATKEDVQSVVDGAKWQILMFCIAAVIALVGMFGTYVTVLVNTAGKG